MAESEVLALNQGWKYHEIYHLGNRKHASEHIYIHIHCINLLRKWSWHKFIEDVIFNKARVHRVRLRYVDHPCNSKQFNKGGDLDTHGTSLLLWYTKHQKTTPSVFDKILELTVLSSWAVLQTSPPFYANHFVLTLKVLVATIDAQWEGMEDVGLARYKPALLPPCPTIRVLSYSN